MGIGKAMQSFNRFDKCVSFHDLEAAFQEHIQDGSAAESRAYESKRPYGSAKYTCQMIIGTL